jgi:hypothetical protein
MIYPAYTGNEAVIGGGAFFVERNSKEELPVIRFTSLTRR